MKRVQQSPSALLVHEDAFDRPKKKLPYLLKSEEDLVILILDFVPIPFSFLILLLFHIAPGKVDVPADVASI